MKERQIIKYKNIWFALSLAFIIPGIIAISLGWLQMGLDFIGGTLIELEFNKKVEVSQVSDSMNKVDSSTFSDAIIQPSENIISIRSKPIDNVLQTKLFDQFKQDFGEFETRRVEVVGPTIGAELFRNSMWGFILVLGGIILYLSFRFRYDYAICAIIALVHDVIFVVGIFAILGKFFAVEIDSLFVTAVLTVAGFSVHDTIVVYDRIRENIKRSKRGTPIEQIADDSLNQTMARSINTSLTLVITLVCLVLLGGETIKEFILAMLIGVIAGTYSSIFIASPLLVLWRQMEEKSKTKAKTA